MSLDRKTELKKAYKEIKSDMGVYQIRNQINGKVLISSALDINARFNRERFILQIGVHTNKELLKDWNEYGEDKFLFEILDILEPDEEHQHNYRRELKLLEELWLDKLQPYGEKGYHKKVGGKEQ